MACPSRLRRQLITSILIVVIVVLFFQPRRCLDPPAPRAAVSTFKAAGVAGPSLALSEDGLLPYRLCGADVADGGAGFRAFSFAFNNVSYKLVVTAASAYGADSAEGARLEFLAYYAVAGQRCCRRDNSCGLPHEIAPKVTCGLAGGGRPGGFLFRHPDLMNVAVIKCALAAEDLRAMRGAPLVAVKMDIEGARADCDVCIQHVQTVHAAVLCTEPFFGYGMRSAFWHGVPRYFDGEDLLTSFIVHHLDVARFGHVTINAYDPAFRELVRPFAGARVAYRGGWDIAFFMEGDDTNHEALDFEVLAEATCLWEHRLDARWVFIVHAADNFLSSAVPGEGVSEALARIDASKVSGIELPIVIATTNHSIPHDGIWRLNNVLQRWSLRAPCPADHMGSYGCGDWRTIPAANPRHVDHHLVHENKGRLALFRDNVKGDAAFGLTKLFVTHILGLAREDWDSNDGVRDAALSDTAERLDHALEATRTLQRAQKWGPGVRSNLRG